ncbi:tRNA lysidine(34) synthetase TilS [Streptococcus sp. ZJ151]|uniref:tRNA lysidine(34) synthetase TilS n=1 Tax=Streptococcus jiangjianxini TaxID=3161189 RepID=UPI0032EEA8C1
MIKPTDFLRHVQKKQFFASHQKVLIAVSGGVDSMNLLHFLYVSRETLNIDIGIAHVNHHQREASKMEEAYLKDWTDNHNIPFYLGHFQGKFTEKKARDFRYNFFKDIMQRDSYTALVTAHHADDQIETIFMRLIRGSKLRYQTGIREKQAFANGELIRPLLPFSKNDFPDIFHFEDSSNQENDYLRNRIRNHYLPELRQENPNLNQAILRHGQDMSLLIEALQDLTKDIDKQDCLVFRQQTPAVQRFLLEEYLSNFSGLQMGQSQFEQLLSNLNSSKSYDFPLKNHYHFKKSNERYSIYKISPETDSQLQEVLLEYGSLVTLENYSFSYSEGHESYLEFIPLPAKNPVILRHRKPGDRILVKNISKKLRRFFIDEKINEEDRRKTIIVEQDNHIVAVICQGKTYLSNPYYHDIMKGRLYIQKM